MRKIQGFSIIEVIIIVVIIVIIGALGWVGYNSWKKNSTTKTSTSTSETTIVPEVKKTSDLDTVTKMIDATDLSTLNTDSQQLSSQASAF